MGRQQNFRIIREFRQKTPSEVQAGTGISKQNISLWDNEKGNPGQEFVDQLANYFDLPTTVFYLNDLTEEYLKKKFSGENHTPVDKASDNKEKPPESIYRDLVESNSEYRLVPKIILDNYEIIPKRELEERAAIVREALDAKNYAIAQLEKEIASLRSREVTVLHAEKAQ